jgi:hypothetical protein
MNEQTNWRRTFRRTAREAVIFMLAGLALSAVGMFVYSYHEQARSIRFDRLALKVICDSEGLTPLTIVKSKTLPKTIPAPVPVAPPGFNPVPTVPTLDLVKCTAAFGSETTDLTAGLDISDQLARDYVEARAEGLRIKNLKVDFADCALTGAIGGGFGFVGGFGVWLFYRLVRFAVKG